MDQSPDLPLSSNHDPEARSYPDWREKSIKAEELDQVLLRRAEGSLRTVLDVLLHDEEVHLMQSYANTVSVRRLGYNDHGPVHARITTYNALKILRLLDKGGVTPSLVAEQVGTYEDAQVGLAIGCFLHDVGMGVARKDHEHYGIQLADDIIKRVLAAVYPSGDARRIYLRALAHECIAGHMATYRIHSVEAGVVLVADGSDMAKGRSRISQLISQQATVGDIHRYSASAIDRVDIKAGEAKPVSITATMANVTGLFQVEEVLMTKVKASPIMQYMEVKALVGDDPPRYYLR
ncbi:MAG: phosphohydrolase [Bacteroidota bacterium]